MDEAELKIRFDVYASAHGLLCEPYSSFSPHDG